MTEEAGAGPEPPRAAQGAHPRLTRARRPRLHRDRENERPDPGDHPGRRRRDGLVLQPLRDEGGTLRRRRRGRPRRLRRHHGPAHRRHRRSRPGVRPELPAHRPAAPPQARSQQGAAAQRPGAHRIGRRDWPPAPAATSKPPPAPGGSPSATSIWLLPSWPGPRCAWASCCTTTRSAMTPRPPTRSPRTCFGCSASTPTRPTTSAGARCPTPTRYRKATRPRRAAQPIIGRRPAVMAPCFLRGRRLTEGPTSDCSPGQVDLRGDTLGTHQDRKQPELANTGKR